MSKVEHKWAFKGACHVAMSSCCKVIISLLVWHIRRLYFLNSPIQFLLSVCRCILQTSPVIKYVFAHMMDHNAALLLISFSSAKFILETIWVLSKRYNRCKGSDDLWVTIVPTCAPTGPSIFTLAYCSWFVIRWVQINWEELSRVCVFKHVRVCQCDLWALLVQLKRAWMWYCFLYSADIETLLSERMKKTAHENQFIFFFKEMPLTPTVYKCKQCRKTDLASESVTMRDSTQPWKTSKS